MQQTILFRAPGRASSKPVKILGGIDMSRKYSINHFAGVSKMLFTTLRSAKAALSRTLSKAWESAKCNCTPSQLLKAAFSEKAAITVGAVVVCAIWWHNLTISDSIAAGQQAALDCLALVPWCAAWAVRSTANAFRSESAKKKGGEK